MNFKKITTKILFLCALIMSFLSLGGIEYYKAEYWVMGQYNTKSGKYFIQRSQEEKFKRNLYRMKTMLSHGGQRHAKLSDIVFLEDKEYNQLNNCDTVSIAIGY